MAPNNCDQEVANRDRVDGRSLPQLQITACAHETVQRVPPFKVPTTEVFCLHGFVDWCRFASTSIHCPSAADMGEVLLARLLLFLLACCLPPCLLPQVPSCAWVSPFCLGLRVNCIELLHCQCNYKLQRHNYKLMQRAVIKDAADTKVLRMARGQKIPVKRVDFICTDHFERETQVEWNGIGIVIGACLSPLASNSWHRDFLLYFAWRLATKPDV
jgi:hypothetical protein